MTFCTCDFITDRSIASYKKIFLSILVKDKLATPDIEQQCGLVLRYPSRNCILFLGGNLPPVWEPLA